MRRDLLQGLQDWKAAPKRKPLVLRGARQVGKTWLLREFGRLCFEQIVYLNFEEDPSVGDLFAGRLQPATLLRQLEVYTGQAIDAATTLLVFDEVQVSERALNALKYFAEEAPEHHVVAAGSLLGLRVDRVHSFPVGKVTFLDLHPLSFAEFLDACGDQRYRELLEELAEPTPLAAPLHEELLGRLRRYLCIGGMPEAVACHVDGGSFADVRRTQNDIVDGYRLDFAKYASPSDIPKLSIVWDSIPTHLARENKKFVFAALRSGARARQYESALSWLRDAGLIHVVHRVERPVPPLQAHAQPGAFKVYALDVGLLSAMVRVPEVAMLEPMTLFDEFRGAIAENYVAQQLVQAGRGPLHYWASEKGKAEVDFLVETGGEVVPLEVKSGINPRSKSLRSYVARYGPTRVARTTPRNLRTDGGILNYPLYALLRFPRW